MKLNINPKPVLLDNTKLDEVLKLKRLRTKAIRPINNRKLTTLIIWSKVDGIDITFDNPKITNPRKTAKPINDKLILDMSSPYGPISFTPEPPDME
jgi:hypothetical protein